VIFAGDFELIYDPSVGEAEAWYINDHTIFRDDAGTWHLIGITHAEPMAPFDELHLAHATAPALRGPWTKQPFALSTDAAWGETHLWAPHVLHHDGTYWMYYCAGGAGPSEYRIHLATSEDGWTWTRHPNNPLIVDGYEARDPMVCCVDDRWVLYYTATSEPEGGHHVVVAAESGDLVHWGGRRVVYTDPMQGTGAGPTESPFVFERDGRWYLLIGPDWHTLTTSFEESGRYDLRAYRRTRVIASDDPLAFDLADQVGTIDAHAAEVVVDEQATWWVTHCGWAQGGVFLAPVSWADPAC
jgi:beta-fructofuranosidase